MTATKAELEEALEARDKTIDELKLLILELTTTTAELEETIATLKNALKANIARAKAAPAPATLLAVLTAKDGIIVLGDSTAQPKQNKANSKGFAVDVSGEDAEKIAHRLIPNKRAADGGIWMLPDGTWRVKCNDHRQAHIVHDTARSYLRANEQQARTTVKISPLGGAAIKAFDATRETGVGVVENNLVAIACTALTVGLNADGSLTLTPSRS